MNRRAFVARLAGLPVAAGAALTDSGVELEAIVAPRLPARFWLPSSMARTMQIGMPDLRLFEVRVYGSCQPGLARVLRRLAPQARKLPPADGAGSETAWLIPFHSLTDREQTWNRVNAQGLKLDSYRFSIYRVAG